MKPQTPFKTLLLLVLLVAAGGFISCEKPENPNDKPTQTDSVPTTSDVDIQGTWLLVNPEAGDGDDLRVIFYKNFFNVICHGSYWEGYYIHPQWPANGYFVGINNGNYLAQNGKFYLWHVTPFDNFAVIPYNTDILPTFDMTLHGDTLELQCLYTRENCPDLTLPEEDHYTFVKINR